MVERRALWYYRLRGYRILAANAWVAGYELDLVVRRGRRLVFCEVKTRIAGTRRGPAGPLDAIGPKKRLQVRAMAREWLVTTDGSARPHRPELRFDAIGVLISRSGRLVSLDHVENAF